MGEAVAYSLAPSVAYLAAYPVNSAAYLYLVAVNDPTIDYVGSSVSSVAGIAPFFFMDWMYTSCFI